MITLSEACKIIQTNIPRCRIISWEDYGDFYAFDMKPRTWNGDRKTCPIGGGIDAVNKTTGDIFGISIESLFEYDDSVIKTLDILPYLSNEDRVFAMKVQKRIEEDNRRLEEMD